MLCVFVWGVMLGREINGVSVVCFWGWVVSIYFDVQSQNHSPVPTLPSPAPVEEQERGEARQVGFFHGGAQHVVAQEGEVEGLLDLFGRLGVVEGEHLVLFVLGVGGLVLFHGGRGEGLLCVRLQTHKEIY